MNWPGLATIPWKHVAIVAGVAGAVAAIGFLSDSGPIQGSSGKILLHRTENECLVHVDLHFGDASSRQSEWVIYGNDMECSLFREATKTIFDGRESLGTTIEAVKK